MQRHSASFALATLAPLLFGCGGSTSSETKGGPSPDPVAPTLTPGGSEIGPVLATAFGEATVCMYKRMDNAEAGYVRRMQGDLSPGSHHMIVYTSEETEEQLTPFPCGGFEGIVSFDDGGVPGLDSKNVPIFIAQQPHVEIDMPDDKGVPVGFRIEAHQMLLVELHWYNTTAEDRDVTGSFQVEMLPEDHPIVESSFGFWGSVAIDIPPASKGDTGVLFQRALSDTMGFAMTTHQHALGTRMRIWDSPDGSVTDERLLVDGTDWADPPMKILDPAVSFSDGGGLAYQCEWNNTTTDHVGFGEGFHDEMCFLWMYYYPSRGFDICVHFDASAQQGVCNHLVR